MFLTAVSWELDQKTKNVFSDVAGLRIIFNIMCVMIKLIFFCAMLPGQNFRVAQSVAQDFYLNQIPSHAVSQILIHQNRPDQSCV